MDIDNGSWEENRKVILYRLNMIDIKLDAQSTKLDAISDSLVALDTRAKIYGAAAGAVVGSTLSAIVTIIVTNIL